MTGKELAKKLDVSEATVHQWRKDGCPRDEDNGYDLMEVARWLLGRQYQGKAYKKAWELVHGGQEVPEPTEPDADQLGIAPALERIRKAEAKAYDAWQRAHEAGNPVASQRFKEWQQAGEALRRMEGSLLEVLQQRRELLPADEVKAWMARQIELAKVAMLNIPAKTAPELEGMTWPQIQQRLTEEITHALDKLSDSPTS